MKTEWDQADLLDNFKEQSKHTDNQVICVIQLCTNEETLDNSNILCKTGHIQHILQ